MTVLPAFPTGFDGEGTTPTGPLAPGTAPVTTPRLTEVHGWGRTAPARTRLTRLGGTMSAFDAWMTLQGLKTLGLRMRAHSGNAQAVADVLANHPRVRAVYHPGLSDHPQFHRAMELYPNGFGGMLSADIEDAPAFVRALGPKLRRRQPSSCSVRWPAVTRPSLWR